MLLLSRKVGQQIRISEDIVVVVVRAIEGGRIKIGIDAPKHVQVLRAELATHPRGLEPSKVLTCCRPTNARQRIDLACKQSL